MHPHGSVSSRMHSKKPGSKFVARLSGPRTPSRGASDATSSSTSPCSMPTSPAKRTAGTATNPNLRCGRRTSPRPIAIHPTAKPVELMERALINSSKTGDLVVDLFGGSGSTLIACERQGRRARLMEIDPRYADCIVRRWQEYTGGQAVLEADSRTFDDLARERVGVMV